MKKLTGGNLDVKAVRKVPWSNRTRYQFHHRAQIMPEYWLFTLPVLVILAGLLITIFRDDNDY